LTLSSDKNKVPVRVWKQRPTTSLRSLPLDVDLLGGGPGRRGDMPCRQLLEAAQCRAGKRRIGGPAAVGAPSLQPGSHRGLPATAALDCSLKRRRNAVARASTPAQTHGKRKQLASYACIAASHTCAFACGHQQRSSLHRFEPGLSGAALYIGDARGRAGCLFLV